MPSTFFSCNPPLISIDFFRQGRLFSKHFVLLCILFEAIMKILSGYKRCQRSIQPKSSPEYFFSPTILQGKSQQVQIDPRRTNAVLLAQTLLPHYDLLLTHSGLSSQETRDGSRQLETYLHQQTIRLHFYGHHHRFSHGLRNEFLYVRVGSMPGHIVSPACRFPPLRSRMQICARSSHALREESRAMCQLIRGVVES
jgi:hypothetical protein